LQHRWLELVLGQPAHLLLQQHARVRFGILPSGLSRV
jgi:hypothetical protein